MTSAVLTTQHPVLTSNRQALPPAVHSKLLELEVESTYNRHDLCVVTFDIDANSEIPPALELGKPFEIGFRGDSATSKIFEGEITALEFDSRENRSVFIVQAECKFHRLFRSDNVRTWVDKTVSDTIKQICNEAGLTPGTIEATTSKIPFQMQQNVTDGDFLLERARELGFHTRMKDGKLFWGKVGAGGDSGVTLELNNHLMGFNCRATANTFVKEATVRSWDAVQKKMIEGKATSYSGRKDAKVAGAFDSPKVLLNRSDLGSIAEAKASAQAVVDRANEHNLQAEGRCWGDVRLAVDKEVKVKGVNRRFDGKYRISHLRHHYSHDEGFITEFSCRGVTDQSLSALVGETATGFAASTPDRSVFEGVTVGIVTDNKDPEEMGRVKVKIPSLEDSAATGWMRVAFPGGGGKSGHHGWYLLPEVEDEVLVVFEQGDVRRGYVIGGLVNGKEKPFYKNSDVIGGGAVNQHAFRLKSGAHFLFCEKSGSEFIELKNKDGNFLFKFDEKKGIDLTNKLNGKKISISSTGDITITGESGNITIEAKAGKLNLKAAQDISIESSGGKVAIKAAQDATIEGLNVKATGQVGAEVKGNATAKLESSGQTVVKGTMVMIN
jgi:uncharacterized protein involved in type VI secretion and phage assembly